MHSGGPGFRRGFGGRGACAQATDTAAHETNTTHGEYAGPKQFEAPIEQHGGWNEMRQAKERTDRLHLRGCQRGSGRQGWHRRRWWPQRWPCSQHPACEHTWRATRRAESESAHALKAARFRNEQDSEHESSWSVSRIAHAWAQNGPATKHEAGRKQATRNARTGNGKWREARTQCQE